jgi:hypothetical protein
MSASDDLEDASRFISPNGSVYWGRLGVTAVVGLILTWLSGVADFVFALFDGPARLISGTLAYIRESVSLIFEIPLPGISAGFEAVRETLPLVGGPFEFTIGVLLVITWFWLLNLVLERLEVLG